MRLFLSTAGLGALALALTTTTALAGGSDIGLRGSIDVEYAHVDSDHDVDPVDLWGGGAHIMANVSGNWNVQLDGGYANLNGDDQSIDGWDISGSVFWRNERGAIGVAIAHGGLSGDVDTDVTAYGAFGEAYLGDFTLAARGGFYSGSHDLDGNYWGAGAKFYVMPDLSVSAGADQVHVEHSGHVTAWNVGAEWQPMDRMPLSVFGDYAHNDVSDSDFSWDTWMVGLRFRFGDEGGTSLQTGDRTNVVRNTTVDLTQALTFR